MLNVLRAASALLLSVFIVSCASQPRLTALTSQTSNVRFAVAKGHFPPITTSVIDIGETFAVMAFDSGTCENQRVIKSLHAPKLGGGSFAGQLNMPLGEFVKNDVYEVPLDANIELRIAFEFSYLRGGPFAPIATCGIAKEFTFQEGHQYEFVGTFETYGKCNVQVSELVVENGDPVRKLIENLNDSVYPLPGACSNY